MLLNLDYAENNNFDFFQRTLFREKRPELVSYADKLLSKTLALRSEEERFEFLKRETLRYCSRNVPAYRRLKKLAVWDEVPVLSRETFRERAGEYCNPEMPYDFLITSRSTLGEGGKFVQRSDLEFFFWDYYRYKSQKKSAKVLAIRFLDHSHGFRVLERSGGHETRLQIPLESVSHMKMLAKFLINDKRLDKFEEIIFRGPQAHTRSLVCFLQENGLKYRRRAKVVAEMGSSMAGEHWKGRLRSVFGKSAEILETYGISEFPMSNSPVPEDGGIKFPLNALAELVGPDGRILKAPYVLGEFAFSHLVPFTLRQPLLRYCSADLGFFDEKGRMFFQGRKGHTVYRDGLKFFGRMHIDRVLDGNPHLYYDAEYFPKFSQEIIKDRRATWPELEYNVKGGKTLLTVYLTKEARGRLGRVKAEIEGLIDGEIRRLGMAPGAVLRNLELSYKVGPRMYL